ncbi:RagB/SusD family nutrient uptake outer membrane protein [Hymenobacter psychrophilus]|uniref:Starch-binding associating with outer membrane n=1 Tax=Hymenobacter psychrophilus TaxID=651662 RepID=A0A1H3CJV5_9BACT|nr:RagB/SusD family nutrient uptake outer membrane protein [Hymenobacter psychrophilus]SDX54385.1 Starch-binding associating with outer membrane [Hymenobacter psychrophilus]
MKKNLLLLSLLGLSLGSCKSFLEETPYDFVASDTFYKSEGDLVAGLNGAYGALLPQLYFGRTAWQITELPGDYIRVGSASDERAQLSRFTYDERLNEVNNWWTSIYLMVNRANDVIERGPGVPMDEARRNNLIGNARFLRGMAYFDLVRCFGDVPLVLSTVKSPDDNLKPTRTPAAQVYEQVIADLQFAEANCLAENQIPGDQKGRASKGAAAALLAKLYLTRAGSPAAKPTDMADALSAVNRVINSGLYRLVPIYSDVFDPDKENGPEHIFSIQFDLPPNIGSIIVRQFTPAQIVPDGLGTFSVEPTFVTSYAATDVRRAWNITNRGSNGATLPRYSFVKFKDPLRIGNDSRANYLVARYADILLLQSEILNNINPADPAKYTGINAVRVRAGLAPLTGTTTKDAFVDLLVRERGWELCIEGHRWYDLTRLKRLNEAVVAAKPTLVSRVEPRYYLFPIPVNESILNPNLTQNPGYGQ